MQVQILTELRRGKIIHLCSANNKRSKPLGIECSVFNEIYTKYCRKYRHSGVSCSCDSGLNIFINKIVGYIDLGGGGLHAPPIGVLNIFRNSILGYIDLGGSMPH
jgi:hypothetical protein